ncbi:MAG: anthranilate synthase component I [Nitrospiraceae bacterium]|nr:anthranilate synthase component I [Nitrospiraceae bacterium]
MMMKKIERAGVFPDRRAFLELAGQGNLIPVYMEVLADTLTPVSAYLMLRGERPSFLLESVLGGEKWARYSFLGLAPRAVIKARGRRMEIRTAGGVQAFEEADPLERVREFMKAIRPARAEDATLPRFYGGLVGYIGYDMVRFMEELPDRGRPGLDMPDLFLMLTGMILIFDNLRQKLKIVANVHLDDGASPEEAYDLAVEKIVSIRRRLAGFSGAVSRQAGEDPADAQKGKKMTGMKKSAFESSFGSPKDFMDAVDRTKQYVMAGDIVQGVLSQRFQRKTSAHPFAIYRALRVINPSPYMYYIDTGQEHIVGSSPEILVRLEGGDITLRPIAGTRRRGATLEEDLALEEELKADPKEQAEHIMLVDLGRNDVGRVAGTGSVKVPELMVVERYSHVMHIVSSVEGRLKPGLGPFDLLRACFPAGTVSGAPKVRAMQIIEELEPVKRGPYAGAVGYFSYSGNMDTCITIRTLIIKEGMVYVQAGAGIVADSVPESEYAETVNKARAMMEAVEMAENEISEDGGIGPRKDLSGDCGPSGDSGE